MPIPENQKRKEGAGQKPSGQRSKSRPVNMSRISDHVLSAHGRGVVIEHRRADDELTQSLQINRIPFFMELVYLVIDIK